MILIGTSSGGLKALQALLGGLPADFASPVAVVLHRHKDSDDALQYALQRCCSLPVTEVVDKMPIQPGHVYLAPPDYHLLVEPAAFSLSTDEPVLCARPAIDVLFESAADAFRRRAIAVVLTGASEDGTRGAVQVLKRGGQVIVQDPSTAECPLMPASALAATHTRLVKPLEQIAATLREITRSWK